MSGVPSTDGLPGGGAPHPTSGGTLAHEGTLHGARLLVVLEDDVVRGVIGRMLEVDGAEVVGAESGEAALARLRRSEFDLVILDVGLPGISGLETLRRLREQGDVPVMMLSTARSLAERGAGFDLGADDYLVRPFEVPELGRRARALLRRARGGAGHAVDEIEGPGGLVIRLRSHEVLIDRVALELTPKEFAILSLLLRRRGEVVSPDALSQAIWGYETFGSRNFVEAHISRLRAKLARRDAGQIVTTIRGVGYVIR